jgi:hypothetical protein
LRQQIHFSQLPFSNVHNHSIISLVAELSNKILVKRYFFDTKRNTLLNNVNAFAKELKKELNHE